MASYGNSTQKNYWLLTVDQLQALRLAGAKKLTPTEITIEEFAVYRIFFVIKTFQICERLGYPMETVASTAVVFLKRYFLNPQNLDMLAMMFTCIFLACKTEENHRVLNHFLADIRKFGLDADAEIILQYEVILLESLKFHLHIYHPYRPLSGFLEDLVGSNTLGKDAVHQIHTRANNLIRRSLATDLCFLAHPPLVALVALRMASKGIGQLDPVDAFLREKLPPPQFASLVGKKDIFQKIGEGLSTEPDHQLIESQMESLKQKFAVID